MKKSLASILLFFVLFSTSGFGCKTQSAEVQQAMKPVTLTYWRVWDDQDAFKEVIAKYNTIHPNIKIEYRKLRYEEYENELLNAMAEDRGPDIFSIPNTWVGKYKTKIEPMPESITMAYPTIKGTLKKETIVEIKTNKSITLKELKTNFVDVVYHDVVFKDKDDQTGAFKENVYGLPLSVDTLVLYYNKDLFNNAGIAEPPAFWNKTMQQYVQKLTKQNTKGDLLQSGIALGGSVNVDRSVDIVSLLMMQNGATMLSDDGTVGFAETLRQTGTAEYNPGAEALRFYIDFANPSKEVYSWNDELNSSLKMFMDNKLAMMLGYSYFLPTIKAESPKLNFGIAALPQIENSSKTVNFANYWIETVSKKSKSKTEAWDFIQYIAKAEQAQMYLEKTKKPTALRSLVNKQLDDVDIGPFAAQVLTAKSWYKGKGAIAMEQILINMIKEASLNQEELQNSMRRGAQRVQQTIR